MEIQCLLCLELNTDSGDCIDIYADEWREQNIESLIEKHLWPMDTLKSQSPWLCTTCWNVLHEFHQFYRRIEDANFCFEYFVKSEQNIQIEECKIIDFLQDDLSENNTECEETAIRSGSSDNDIFSIDESQTDGQGHGFKCHYCLKDLKEQQAFLHHIAWHEGYMNHKRPLDNSIIFVDDQKSTDLFRKKTPHISSDNILGESSDCISGEKKSDESMSNSNSKIFKCKYCCKMLKEKRLLLKHIAWHKGNVYICEICDLKFVDKSKLEHHKLAHTSRGKSLNHDDKIDNAPTIGVNRSVSSLSSKSLEKMETEEQMEKDKLNLKSNLNKHTIECKYCSKVLEDQRAFAYHIAWHKGNVYGCEICDLKFVDLNKFKSHKSSHKVERKWAQFSNEENPKLYTVSDESEIEDVKSGTRAITARNEEVVFHCVICDLKFADATKFDNHKSTHASERTRSCDSNGEKDGALIEEIQEDVDHLQQEHLNQNELESEIEENEDDGETNTKSNISSNLDSNLKMEEIKCKFCFRVLEDERVMLNHKAWHEGDTFHCNECELKFFDKSKFENHKLSHAMSNDTSDNESDDGIQLEYFVCKFCSKVLNNKRLLLNHSAWHVGNTQQCYTCDLKFFDKIKYDNHVSTHLTEPRIPCPDCGKTFPYASIVRRHRDKMHRNKDVQVCDVCGKPYRCPLSFKRHMDKHEGKTPPKLPCDICGRLLKGKLSLKSHMLINHPKNGMLPYVCDICLKPLATRAILNRHIVTAHNNVGEYKCPVCNKIFKKLVDLQKHSTIHSAEPKVACAWCPEKFFSSSNLSRHKKKSHPKEYEEWKSQLYVQL